MNNMKELTEKAHLLRQLKREAEDLATRIKNLEDEFKAIMTEENVSELKGEDWIITWSEVTSSRFDQSSFKEAHPELFESFKVPSTSRRFSLK